MSDLIHQAVFLGFAGMTLVSAILVVALRNLLHAAVSLFFCLTGIAALYIMLGADFLGVAQLLIYGGGILVLIIFGVFLTARIQEGTKLEVSESKMPVAIGVFVAASVFGVIWMVLDQTEWSVIVPTYAPTTSQIGNLFLTKYLLGFELISILLLFAMVGAALLVRKEMEKGSK